MSRRTRLVAVAVLLSGCASGGSEGVPETPDGALPEPVDAAIVDVVRPVDAEIDVEPPDAAPVGAPDLPQIHDYSGASPERVLVLVRAALDGLGFDPASGQGPQPGDRVFVGKHYLAWLDQTGFYGKMNGLWTLNAAAGDALDFVLKDPDGRPVNFFVVGEDGDGVWPSGYKGAEHLEFPNRVPEANDNPNCKNGDWCNQYGLDEAVPFTNPKIQHWSSCNLGAVSFAVKHDPVVIEPRERGLKIVYEGKLVKEADGDGNFDGDACHQDFLFPDGVRRVVKFRVGYELNADFPSFDRILQLVNPAGNPTLVGDMSMIGGFVATTWPNPHYLKGLDRYWRPEAANLTLNWAGESILLTKSVWTFLATRAPAAVDVLLGWIDQPLSLSATPGYAAGRSATVSHVGEIDNADVGACLCTIHGGLEMGGGLLHKDISLPIQPGQSTKEARRRLTVPSNGAAPVTRGLTYEAETQLGHNICRLDGDGWSCNTGADSAGHLAFGPYATDWGGGTGQAVFWLMVDNNSAANDKVVTLEIRDADTSEVFAVRPVFRHEFRKPSTYQRFAVDFSLLNRVGHRMEVRVDWHDVSYVRLDKVSVNLVD
jgi:hypothetical protein